MTAPRRIDAHQHFWRLDRGDYGWLTPADAAIYRDFGPADLAPLLARAGYGTLASGGVALLPDWARAMLRIPLPGPIARHVGQPLGRLGTAAVRWGMAALEDRRPRPMNHVALPDGRQPA